MVAVGMMMLLVSWWALFSLRKEFLNGDSDLQRLRGERRFLLNVLSIMTFSGWVAVLAGWYVTEIGRQPWIVQDVIHTADVVADHSSGTMLGTLIAYLASYIFLLVSYILTLMYMSSKPARSLLSMQALATLERGEAGVSQ